MSGVERIRVLLVEGGRERATMVARWEGDGFGRVLPKRTVAGAPPRLEGPREEVATHPVTRFPTAISPTSGTPGGSAGALRARVGRRCTGPKEWAATG